MTDRRTDRRTEAIAISPTLFLKKRGDKNANKGKFHAQFSCDGLRRWVWPQTEPKTHLRAGLMYPLKGFRSSKGQSIYSFLINF